MENRRKQIARVLQPAAKPDMTNMSPTQRFLYRAGRVLSVLWSGITGGSQALGSYIRQVQKREYIPLSPVRRAHR